MEHRWNARRPLTVKAILHSPVLGPERVKIRDIGAGGVRVEVQDDVPATNLHVELVFVGNERGILRIYRVPALIVWTSKNMVGLMFYEMSPRAVVAVLNAFSAGEVEGDFESGPSFAGGPSNASGKLTRP